MKTYLITLLLGSVLNIGNMVVSATNQNWIAVAGWFMALWWCTAFHYISAHHDRFLDKLSSLSAASE